MDKQIQPRRIAQLRNKRGNFPRALKEGAVAGGLPLIGAAGGNGAAKYPPTPAMKRFAHGLARQKGIKPPPGYQTSISICRKLLDEHAPKKSEGENAEKFEPKSVSPAQVRYRNSSRRVDDVIEF